MKTMCPTSSDHNGSVAAHMPKGMSCHIAKKPLLRQPGGHIAFMIEYTYNVVLNNVNNVAKFG